ETTPLPPEVNPRLVFERLFGAGEDAADPASRARRRQQDGSILDLVQEEARSLTGSLGPADRRKLDEYLSALREIEKRLEETERTREPAADLASGIEKPSGIPVDFQEHIRLMLDMIVIAFQADLTPVATLMAGREGSKRTYREIGVPEAHHGLTHHKGDPEKIRQVARINTFHVEQLAYFFGKLKSVRDGDGTLLDHSMILYGSGLSDGDRHDHHDLPVLLAGKGGGALHPGRHVRYPVETPMTNLYLTVLDRMGVRPESVGDSTGRLEHLSGI
ncbi:MAG: DUF1552 domain-containing protein, partial [Acidobacteria bacterium]|nr:DUF1552 domain-containing protein [Acidobacteriota bacterium]